MHTRAQPKESRLTKSKRACSRVNRKMTYRLNLYSNAKLISTELVEASLSQARELACSALDHGRASGACKRIRFHTVSAVGRNKRTLRARLKAAKNGSTLLPRRRAVPGRSRDGSLTRTSTTHSCAYA